MKIITAILALTTTAIFAQGPLTPPGAPAPTMKSLDEIHSKVADVGERRTPISSLPFTISASGSYYLTGNLSVSSGDGITVSTSNVTIDMNGFTLSGAASGNGIALSAGNDVRISNGMIRNWGTGIYSFGTGRIIVEKVHFLSCSSHGISVSAAAGTEVRNSVVADCGGHGIVVQGASIIEGNSVRNNAGSGIRIEAPLSEVRGNSVSQNNIGVELIESSVCVEANTLKFNFYGLRIVNSGNSVRRNTLRSNSNPNIIFAGNDVAPFQSAATATNPFANLSY